MVVPCVTKVRLVETIVHDAAPPLGPAARLMLLSAASKLSVGGGAGDFVCWWCLT